MPRRLSPCQAAKLAQVQQVRKVASETAVIAACNAEGAARTLHRSAQDDADAALDCWFGHLSAGIFEPERANRFASHSIVKQAEAGKAAVALEDAAASHLRRQADFRVAAARVERADAALKGARRDVAKGREERRLANMSDRVTFNWVKA